MRAAIRSRTSSAAPPGVAIPATPHIVEQALPHAYSRVSAMKSSPSAPPDLTMSAPDIGERERELVNTVLEGKNLSGGPMVERFESAIAELSKRKHAVAVSSGTAGLHLAVKALGIKAGDKVAT